MTCVTSVSYAVLVNGQPGDKIVPTRGLHQGDLISLYLYLICVEGLSTLIHNTEELPRFEGLRWLGVVPLLVTSSLLTTTLSSMEPL